MTSFFIQPNNPLVGFNPHDFKVVVTCADGLENALLIELDSLGMAGELLRPGRVAVRLSLSDFYQLCLYSRVASRILLPLGEYHFKQKTDQQGNSMPDEDVPEALYRFARLVDWTKIFGLDKSFAIRLSTDKRLVVNQQFATLRIKDAVADTFNSILGARPDVDAKSPDFHIFAAANNRFAELFLDLSGTSLHRRSYRVANTAAPLKENLAAALLYECGWHTGQFDALIDPMCGSGTFIIEAMLMRANYPAGLDKAGQQFGFYDWQYHDQALWESLVAKATKDFHEKLARLQQDPLVVLGMDADPAAIHASHKNLLASGLAELDFISLEQRPASSLPKVLSNLKAQAPLIISNPPYGERLGDGDFIKPLYQGLGLLVASGLRKADVPCAYMAILASQVEQADTLPLIDPKTLRCHNGALSVYFRHGQLKLSPLPSLISCFEKREIVHDQAQEFINRLQKNLANLKKQAKKQDVTNLRVYDADLPNFNVAIDIYGDKIHVQEYAPPKQIPAQTAKLRFNLVLSCVREIFGVSRESIFIKTRARQSGNEQYTKNDNADKRKKMWIVAENPAYFYVNFTDYLDTGLFIDHRNMRQLVAQASRGKRVLNLFSYTCTASVHAALAGAKTVTSVDLSANYLDWGRQNFSLNGLVLDAIYENELKYQFIAADTFEWIKQNTAQYDVIFIDPPTFSNSKKFKGTFDVQRDHVALINRAMNRLASGGVLYFSNNYTRFELDESLKARYQVLDITDRTIGFDFNPKKPIHHSFEIRHKTLSVPAIPDSELQDDFDDRFLVSTKTYQDGQRATHRPKPPHKPGPTGATKKTKTAKKPKSDHQRANPKKPEVGAVASGQSTAKRVYVNPKLENADQLARSLQEKLSNHLADKGNQAQSSQRLGRIKKS